MNNVILERFLKRVIVQPGGCWGWSGAISQEGYATFAIEGKKASAARAAYEHWKGPIPTGLVIDHLCRNRSCVNPDHLEAVTNRENILRGEGLAAKLARRTCCKAGHPFDEGNTRYYGGRRKCLLCQREYDRRFREKRIVRER